MALVVRGHVCDLHFIGADTTHTSQRAGGALSPNPSPNPSREGWKPTMGDAEPYETTFRMVLDSKEDR